MNIVTPEESWPVGDSDMARRIRAHDWTASPLGPVETWPERLKAIVEISLASPLISSVACGDERLLIYNDAAAAIYGDRHPAALGRPLAESFPKGYPAVAPLYDRVFAGQAVHVAEQPLGLDGHDAPELRFFDAWLTPVRGPDGHVAYAHMIGFDVTDRVIAAKERQAEARFRALVTAGSYATYRMDPAWRTMLEGDGQGFTADTPSPSASWLDRYIPEEDKPRVRAAIEAAILAKGLYELEHRIWRSDGSIGWILSRAVPLLDEQGEITEWFGKATDITRRKEAEAQLRDSEKRFRLMADAVPQLVWAIDADGRVTFFNKQWSDYTGLTYKPTPADAVTADLVHPDDQALTREAIEAARRTGTAFEFEHRIRSASGDYRWFLVRGQPHLEDEKDERPCYFGASIDIHDRHQLLSTQDLLIAELQHRTRNLLAVVNGMARQTERASSSLEEFSAKFHKRLAALGRVQALLSRREALQVHLHELVEAELQAHGTSAEDPRVTIDGTKVMLSPKAAQVLALPLHELATNAVKYGALSQEQAKLSIHWDITDEDGERILNFCWSETQARLADPVQGPRKGFGRELIERALPYDLGGQTSWRLTADGVECVLRMPLDDTGLT